MERIMKYFYSSKQAQKISASSENADVKHQCCMKNISLFDQDGKLCSVFNTRYIFTHIDETPQLISLTTDRSVFKWAVGQLIWKDMTLNVHDRYPDGTKVKFDAIKQYGHESYQILLIWIDLKPTCFTLPMPKCCMVMHCHEGISCTYMKKHKIVHAILYNHVHEFPMPEKIFVDGVPCCPSSFSILKNMQAFILELLQEKGNYSIELLAVYCGSLPTHLQNVKANLSYLISPGYNTVQLATKKHLVYTNAVVSYKCGTYTTSLQKGTEQKVNIINKLPTASKKQTFKAHLMFNNLTGDCDVCLFRDHFCSFSASKNRDDTEIYHSESEPNKKYGAKLLTQDEEINVKAMKALNDEKIEKHSVNGEALCAVEVNFTSRKKHDDLNAEQLAQVNVNEMSALNGRESEESNAEETVSPTQELVEAGTEELTDVYRDERNVANVELRRHLNSKEIRDGRTKREELNEDNQLGLKKIEEFSTEAMNDTNREEKEVRSAEGMQEKNVERKVLSTDLTKMANADEIKSHTEEMVESVANGSELSNEPMWEKLHAEEWNGLTAENWKTKNSEVCEESNFKVSINSNPEVSEESNLEMSDESNSELNVESNSEPNEKSNPEVCEESNPEVSEKSNPEMSNKSNPELSEELNPEVSEESIREEMESNGKEKEKSSVDCEDSIVKELAQSSGKTRLQVDTEAHRCHTALLDEEVVTEDMSIDQRKEELHGYNNELSDCSFHKDSEKVKQEAEFKFVDNYKSFNDNYRIQKQKNESSNNLDLQSVWSSNGKVSQPDIASISQNVYVADDAKAGGNLYPFINRYLSELLEISFMGLEIINSDKVQNLDYIYDELTKYIHLPSCSESSSICMDNSDTFILKNCSKFNGFVKTDNVKVLAQSRKYALLQDNLQKLYLVLPLDKLPPVEIRQNVSILYSVDSVIEMPGRKVGVGCLSWCTEKAPVLRLHTCSQHKLHIHAANDLSFITTYSANNRGAAVMNCSSGVNLQPPLNQSLISSLEFSIIPAEIVAFAANIVHLAIDTPGFPPQVMCRSEDVYLENIKVSVSSMLQNDAFDTKVQLVMKSFNVILMYDFLKNDHFIHFCPNHRPVIIANQKDLILTADFAKTFNNVENVEHSVIQSRDLKDKDNETLSVGPEAVHLSGSSNLVPNCEPSDSKIVESAKHFESLHSVSTELLQNDVMGDTLISEVDVAKPDLFLTCKETNKEIINAEVECNANKVDKKTSTQSNSSQCSTTKSEAGHVFKHLVCSINKLNIKDNCFTVKLAAGNVLIPLICLSNRKSVSTLLFQASCKFQLSMICVHLEKNFVFDGEKISFIAVLAYHGKRSPFAKEVLTTTNLRNGHLHQEEIEELLCLSRADERQALNVFGKVIVLADTYGILKFTVKTNGANYYAKFPMEAMLVLSPYDTCVKPSCSIDQYLMSSCYATVVRDIRKTLYSESAFNSKNVILGSLYQLLSHVKENSNSCNKLSLPAEELLKTHEVAIIPPISAVTKVLKETEPVQEKLLNESVSSHKMPNSNGVICKKKKIVLEKPLNNKLEVSVGEISIEENASLKTISSKKVSDELLKSGAHQITAINSVMHNMSTNKTVTNNVKQFSSKVLKCAQHYVILDCDNSHHVFLPLENMYEMCFMKPSHKELRKILKDITIHSVCLGIETPVMVGKHSVCWLAVFAYTGTPPSALSDIIKKWSHHDKLHQLTVMPFLSNIQNPTKMKTFHVHAKIIAAVQNFGLLRFNDANNSCQYAKFCYDLLFILPDTKQATDYMPNKVNAFLQHDCVATVCFRGGYMFPHFQAEKVVLGDTAALEQYFKDECIQAKSTIESADEDLNSKHQEQIVILGATDKEQNNSYSLVSTVASNKSIGMQQTQKVVLQADSNQLSDIDASYMGASNATLVSNDHLTEHQPVVSKFISFASDLNNGNNKLETIAITASSLKQASENINGSDCKLKVPALLNNDGSSVLQLKDHIMRSTVVVTDTQEIATKEKSVPRLRISDHKNLEINTPEKNEVCALIISNPIMLTVENLEIFSKSAANVPISKKTEILYYTASVFRYFDKYAVLHVIDGTVVFPYDKLYSVSNKSPKQLLQSTELTLGLLCVIIKEPIKVPSYVLNIFAFFGFLGKKPGVAGTVSQWIERHSPEKLQSAIHAACATFTGAKFYDTTTEKKNKLLQKNINNNSITKRSKKSVNSKILEKHPTPQAALASKKFPLHMSTNNRDSHPRGIICDIFPAMGKLRTSDGTELIFQPKQCYLYGVNLKGLELWHVLLRGQEVGYELYNEKGTQCVRAVYVGGWDSKRLKPAELKSRIVDWCLENNVSDDARKLLEAKVESCSSTMGFVPLMAVDPNKQVVELHQEVDQELP